jgi:hypothetical protein
LLVSRDVTAIVLAALGGARLERSLASVAWAGERVVLDPAGQVDARVVPPGVRHVASAARPAELGSAPWLLLLLEGEVASRGFEEALRGSSEADACGVPLELHALDVQWTPRRAPVRLVARAAARLVVRDGRPELAEEGRGTCAGRIVAEAAPSLEDAVRTLDAECGAVAAWLAAGPQRVRLGHLMLPPVAAMLRALAAPGRGTRPWARWVAAVFAGYRTLLVPAKVWELRQCAAIAPALAGGPVRRAEA